MWNMIRSVLLFATDPRNLTSIMTEALLNSEIIAINQASCPMPGATRVATIPCGSTENCQVRRGWDVGHRCAAFVPWREKHDCPRLRGATNKGPGCSAWRPFDVGVGSPADLGHSAIL